jgi:subtilisin family serine protease
MYARIGLSADRLAVSLLLFIFFTVGNSFSGVAQSRRTIKEGVIHVRLSDGTATRIEKSVRPRTTSRHVQTGIQGLDQANRKFQVRKMTRLFKPAGRFEAKHRKYGLHRWYVVELEKGVAVKDALSGFRALSDVERAEPVYQKALMGSSENNFGPVVHTPKDGSLPSNPDDPNLNVQWHYSNTGQTGGKAGADINLFNAWRIETGSPDVVVSVHDGGIDVQHEDLVANLWKNNDEIPGNGIDDDNNGYIDDRHGFNFAHGSPVIGAHDHGTHVGGTVAATTNNGIGVSGVAGGSGNGDGVRIMSCEIFSTDGGSGGFAESYVYAADNGAVISQNSWGYLGPDEYEQPILEAIDYFIAEAGKDEFGNQVGPMSGGIVIFASGNNNSGENYYPGYYAPTLAVAATTHEDKKAGYSNYGAWVDIAAPGGETLIEPTQGVMSTLPNNQYGYFQGTSMACPHVSGIAALVLSKFGGPGYTPDRLRTRLLQRVDNIDADDPDFAGLLGAGRIDAVGALRENDNIGPRAITDLRIASKDMHRIKLYWTSPLDEGDGNARAYDIRYSTRRITAENFGQASKVDNANDPLPAGERDTYTIEGLLPSTRYYIAIRSIDFSGNFSAISNVMSVRTDDPPAAVVRQQRISKSLVTGESGIVKLIMVNNGEGKLLFTVEPEVQDPNFVTAPLGTIQVNPKDSTEVDVTFNAMGLVEGTYYSSIAVKTNDPERQVITVEAELSVSNNGAAIPILSPTSLNFEEVFVNGSKTLPVSLYNGGSELLTINAITSSNAAFQIDAALPLYVNTNQTVTLDVTFTPVSTGRMQGTIRFKADDTTLAINLPVAGLSTQGPTIKLDHDSLETTVYRNQLAKETVMIQNNGEKELTFEILVPEEAQFIQVNPFEGVMAPGETRPVQFYFDAKGLAEGTYRQEITIASNDAVNPELKLPIVLRVLGRQLVVSPSALRTRVPVGGSDRKSLKITNTGNTPAPFSITVQDPEMPGSDQLSKGNEPRGVIANDAALLSHLQTLRDHAKTRQRIDRSLLVAKLAGTQLASSSLYATDFEEFSLGPAFQQGWEPPFSGPSAFVVADSNPFSGQKHLHVESEEGKEHRIKSPMVAVGTEPFTTFSARLNIEMGGAVVDVFPVSSTGQFNAAVVFWPDGAIQAMIADAQGNPTWEEIDEPIPSGYFQLSIEVERETSMFKIFFNDKQVFEGRGTGPDIQWVYTGVTANGDGTTYDIDDFRIIDGERRQTFMVLSPTFGTIPPGGSVNIAVNFNAKSLDLGVYSSDVVLFNNGDKISVPATMTVGSPQFSVSPAKIERTMKEGETYETRVVLKNVGDGTYPYRVRAQGFEYASTPRSMNTSVVTTEEERTKGWIKALMANPELVLSPETFRRSVDINADLHSTGFYATDFEDFESGAPTQNGWKGNGQWSISTANPFSGAQHLRIVCDSAHTSAAVFSPAVGSGLEDYVSTSMKVMLQGSGPGRLLLLGSPGTVYDYSTIISFLDNAIGVLTFDGTEVIFRKISVTIPHGYFDFAVEVERTSGNFVIFLDDREIFRGRGLSGAIDFVKFQVYDEASSGAIFDVDDVKIFNDHFRSNPFLKVGPMGGNLDPADSVIVNVILNTAGLPRGEYLSDIRVTLGDSLHVLPVKVNITGEPALETSPAKLTVALGPGDIESHTFEIANHGDAILYYQLELVDVDSIQTDSTATKNWLTLSHQSSSLHQDDVDGVTITFRAPNVPPGQYSATLRVGSNDPDVVTIDMPIILDITTPARIEVLPDSLSETLYLNSTSAKTLVLRNSGGAPLRFAFEQASPASASPRDVKASLLYPNYHTAKGLRDTRQGKPVTTDAGGPDHAGYKWKDSREIGGPMFSWIEVSETGTALPLGDDEYMAVDLPFDFEFYGDSHRSITVGANGFLTFEEEGNAYFNNEIPDPFGPANFIAAYWDDLDPGDGAGKIHYQAFADKFVVQYTDVPSYEDISAKLTFQVVLLRDGGILLQYLDMPELHSATIGIENQDGTDGLEIAFNTVYAQNFLAVMISPPMVPWVRPEPESGVVARGESQSIRMNFDSKDLPTGLYTTSLIINNNDPSNSRLRVPVSLNVIDNYPPVIADLSDSTVVETASKDFTLIASDPDDSVTTVSVADLPSFITLVSQSNGQAILRATPPIGVAGRYLLAVSASDGNGGLAVRKVAITVLPYAVESFSLVNWKTNQIIATFHDEITINRADEAFRYYIIRANTNPATVGSVLFSLDGRRRNIEKKNPYFFYDVPKLRDGLHDLKATPYSQKNARGLAGKALVAKLNLINHRPQENPHGVPFWVYPNPADKYVNFGVGDKINGMVTLQVFTVTGHSVYKRTLPADALRKYKLDISWMWVGLYYVQVITEDGHRHLARLIVY